MNPGTAATDGVEVEFKVPGDPIAAAFTHSETQALQNFLGALPGDSDRLTEIAEFLRGDKTEFSDVDLLQAVRSLEVRLGLPAIGEKRIDKVYGYIKIQRQIDSLEKERNGYLR